MVGLCSIFKLYITFLKISYQLIIHELINKKKAGCNIKNEKIKNNINK